jgi:hypothetical protein
MELPATNTGPALLVDAGPRYLVRLENAAPRGPSCP